MRPPLFFSFSLATVFFVEGCDLSTPDQTGISVTFTADNLRSASGLVISQLSVRVAEVVFDADGPRDSISVTEEVNALVSVMDGTSDPDLVGIELTPGCYGSPYLGVELEDDGEGPALLLDGSLDGVPIRFAFNSGEVFEAEAESVLVEQGTTRSVEFRLEAQRWFNGVNAAALAVETDGVAEISETSNSEVFDRVADSLDVTTDGRFPSVKGCKKESTKTKD